MRRAYIVTMSGGPEEREVTVDAAKSTRGAARIAVRRTLYEPTIRGASVLCFVISTCPPWVAEWHEVLW